MYTYPYQIIKKKLQADVPELKEVDWFLHQYDTTKKEGNFMTAEPGVYIEFPAEIELQQLGFNIQMADVTWTLHLATTNVFEDDRRVQKVSATDHAMIMDKIFRSLLNWSSKLSYLPAFAALAGTSTDQRVVGTIARVGINPPHVLKSLMVTKQKFRCAMYDHAANPTLQTIMNVPLQISSTVRVIQ
jgi:hypothetical protein